MSYYLVMSEGVYSGSLSLMTSAFGLQDEFIGFPAFLLSPSFAFFCRLRPMEEVLNIAQPFPFLLKDIEFHGLSLG